MAKEAIDKGWNIVLSFIGKLGINTLRSALEKRLPDGSPEEEIVTVTAPSAQTLPLTTLLAPLV